jgi:DNA-binding XRE family transcriptional regulator
MSIRPNQLIAGRALLGWSQDTLGEKAGVARRTISDMERGTRMPSSKIIEDLRHCLEQAGVHFYEDDYGLGVYLRQSR